jgi:hypothetical protein
VRAIRFLLLISVSQGPGHFVFRSTAPKSWPIPEELLRFSAKTLNDRGIVKLRHITYNGDSGIAFITRGEAEALLRHFGMATLEKLSQAQITARRDLFTMWMLKGSPLLLKSTNNAVNQRKAWLTQARPFLGGEGEKPHPIIAWVGTDGNLRLFSDRIPLHSVKNVHVRIDLEYDGEQGFLIVDFPSGQPIVNKKGARLERILITENGLRIPPVHFWTQPKSKPAVLGSPS